MLEMEERPDFCWKTLRDQIIKLLLSYSLLEDVLEEAYKNIILNRCQKLFGENNAVIVLQVLFW